MTLWSCQDQAPTDHRSGLHAGRPVSSSSSSSHGGPGRSTGKRVTHASRTPSFQRAAAALRRQHGRRRAQL